MGWWRWLTGKDGSATATWDEGAGLTIPVSTVAETVDLAIPAKPIVTASLLKHLGWTDPAGYAPHMADACTTYGITTRQRLACFLGQVGHESLRGFYTAEIWGPTAAQKGYEGRKDLGNTQPGDGLRYRGRGLIQITGRSNYMKAAAAFGMCIEALPKWLETREGAVTSAAWWWKTNGCNELADRATTDDGFAALTKRINGGTNGLTERRALYQKALGALA
jgi:putative chitinase